MFPGTLLNIAIWEGITLIIQCYELAPNINWDKSRDVISLFAKNYNSRNSPKIIFNDLKNNQKNNIYIGIYTYLNKMAANIKWRK